MSSFWTKLPRPFFALAPMEDVTDAAFRRLIAKYSKYGGRDIGVGSKGSLPAEAFRAGGPDVMFTEFTSADGLVFANEAGQKRLRAKLAFSETERPIVVQLFTAAPERMEKAARMMRELGFDGIDINMGCPDRAVEKSGCGAALIKNPKLARELIRAAQSAGLPVSVKTRTGYTEDELDTWLPELLAEHPAAITVHARTRKEMSDVPARWDTVARAVLIRDAAKSETLIVGNGDVSNLSDARAKAAVAGCDGVMLGRAIYGNPWLFNGIRRGHPESEYTDISVYRPTPHEKLSALLEHLKLFEELLGEVVNYASMKKHFKAYVSGWHDAKELRMRLMGTETAKEAQAIIADAIMQV